MKLFLWMAGFIVFATALGMMIAAGEGIQFGPQHVWVFAFNGGLVALLMLAWWLSRDKHNHRAAIAVEPVTLETAAGADGTKRCWFIRRPDGFFSYSEETLVDLGEDGDGRPYWEPTHVSGLFDTAEAAKVDATATLGWLEEGSLAR